MPTYKELRRLQEESSQLPQNILPEEKKAAPSDRMWGGYAPNWAGRGVLPWLGETVAQPGHALMAALDEMLPGGKRPKIGNPLERAGKAFTETLTESSAEQAKHGTEQLLKDRGVDFPGISVAGMIGDAVVDPLNVIPALKITKTLGKGMRGVERAFPVLEKARLNAARGFIRPTVDAFSGMRPEVAEAVRLNQAAHRTAPQRVIEELWNTEITDPVLGKVRALERLSNEQLRAKIGAKQATERVADVEKFLKRQVDEKLLDRTHPDEIVELGTARGMKDLLDVPEVLKKANPAEAARRTQLAQTKVLRDFAENLTPEASHISDKKIFDLLSRMRTAWKKQVTVHNPGFLGTNAAGNLWNIQAASDRSILRNNPLEALRTVGKGGAWLAGAKKDKYGKYSAAEIEQALKQYGVDTGLAQHVSYAPDDIAKTIESVKQAHKPLTITGKTLGGKAVSAATLPFRAYGKGMAALNDVNEKSAKIGVVLRELERGKTLPEALIEAKNALFDYQELTPAMRKIRDTGVPFLTFAAKNFPLQIKNAINKPGSIARKQRFVEQGKEWMAESDDPVPDQERYTSSVNALDPMLGIKTNDPRLRHIIPKKFQTDEALPMYMKNLAPLSDVNTLGMFKEGEQGSAARKLLGDKLGPEVKLLADALIGDYSVPKVGLLGKVPVNAGVENLLSANVGGKELGTRIGMNRYKNKKDPKASEYRVPWLANSLLNYALPITNRVGRSVLSYTEPELAPDPLAGLAWMGLPVGSLKSQSRKANKKAKVKSENLLKNETKRLKKSLFKDEEI